MINVLNNWIKNISCLILHLIFEILVKSYSALPHTFLSVQEVDDDLNFDELILEAAKSIAAATAALIKAASEAQKELVAQGKVSRTSVMQSEDGQWSEGLVSAARMVASATHNLCEAANALVKGQSSEEKLIAAAKQVAGSTAQLLLACKVKADPDSRSMKRLEAASNAVRKATETLVRNAQQVLEQDDHIEHKLSTSGVKGQAQVKNLFFARHRKVFEDFVLFHSCLTREPKFCAWKKNFEKLRKNTRNYSRDK